MGGAIQPEYEVCVSSIACRVTTWSVCVCVVYLHKSGSHVTESGSHLSFQHFCSAVFCRNLAPDESFEDEIRVAIRHTAAAFLQRARKVTG